MMLIVGAIFVVLGGVVFAVGIATANLLYIITGLVAAYVGFHAAKPKKK